MEFGGDIWKCVRGNRTLLCLRKDSTVAVLLKDSSLESGVIEQLRAKTEISDLGENGKIYKGTLVGIFSFVYVLDLEVWYLDTDFNERRHESATMCVKFYHKMFEGKTVNIINRNLYFQVAAHGTRTEAIIPANFSVPEIVLEI